jgi:hypothetical protein
VRQDRHAAGIETLGLLVPAIAQLVAVFLFDLQIGSDHTGWTAHVVGECRRRIVDRVPHSKLGRKRRQPRFADQRIAPRVKFYVQHIARRHHQRTAGKARCVDQWIVADLIKYLGEYLTLDFHLAHAAGTRIGPVQRLDLLAIVALRDPVAVAGVEQRADQMHEEVARRLVSVGRAQ